MKNGKYWGERVRSLTDAVSSAIAITSLGASGLAQALPNISALPWTVVGLVVSLVFWFAGSVVSKMIEESGTDCPD
jgi:hypothetical protein